ncbi:MAG: xanthine dehydrogenase family protein molybdopterin-binding subunit [Gemmatimonadota bacterium]
MQRMEGLSKLSGREQYVDDLPVPGCLWGATVRSPAARGRIREIRFSEEFDWDEFVIVDAGDIPASNTIYLMEEDQPVLADGVVRHVHEPVLLLAHPSRDMARRGATAVEVIVDPEPAVLDFRLPPDPAQIQYGVDNVLKHLRIEKGDVEKALAAAPIVIEGVYETGSQEHVYLETQGMLAWEEDGVITVQGSMQCPYYIVDAFKKALGRDESQIRIVQTPTGGGFGGKEEFPSGIALHAALLALKAGNPVKLVYERGEDMAATTKRHPSRVRHRTAVDEDGRLLAQDIEVLLDGGAYVTLSPVVLSRAIIHAGGPYQCDNVRIDGRAQLSNSVPFGAFRGFGAPQSLFAVERHMDVIADRLGMDPVALRRRNLIRDGDSTATGQIIEDGADRIEVLDTALRLSDYEAKIESHTEFNRTSQTKRRGIGLATFYHGAGFTGGGEVYLDSAAHVAGLPDGGVEVRTASVEMGQGALTIFAQVVAARLGLSVEHIRIGAPDTAIVPNSGPTVASRTSMIVAGLVERACDDLRDQVRRSAAEVAEPAGELPEPANTASADAAVQPLEGDTMVRAITGWHARNPGQELIGKARYIKPENIEWDDETYRGDAYGSFAWAAYVADVEIDLLTFGVEVRDFVAVQEVGKVLNETLARGQIQGGVVQGIGWALLEDFVWRDGAMLNNQLTNYIIPTSDDVPPIRVAFLEVPYAFGTWGCKGIGELPMDGPAPAILNAVAMALGVQATSVPLTPERLMLLVHPELERAG